MPSFAQGDEDDTPVVLDPIESVGQPINIYPDPFAQNSIFDPGGCDSFLGCSGDSAEDDNNDYYNDGSRCVSQEELTHNIEICVATTLGATGAAIGALNSTACSTCFTAPNPISCGTCAALTVFSGLAVRLAAESCQPPELTVCPN